MHPLCIYFSFLCAQDTGSLVHHLESRAEQSRARDSGGGAGRGGPAEVVLTGSHNEYGSIQ